MLVIDLNPYGDLSTKLVKELAELREIEEKFTERYSDDDKYLGLLDFFGTGGFYGGIPGEENA